MIALKDFIQLETEVFGGKDYWYSFQELHKNSPLQDESGISKVEQVIIVHYTTNVSNIINGYLRGNHHDRKTKDFLNLYSEILTASLKKFPSYSNQTVFRMDRPRLEPLENLAWFERNVGKIIEFPCFLSTAKERWCDPYRSVYEIRTATNSLAQNIEPIIAIGNVAKAKNETEVLFPFKSKFIIRDINSTTLTVYLDEIIGMSNGNSVLMNYWYHEK